jgi:hypothetical protein
LSGSIGRAAIVYFALVFAAGFVLGTIRVLLVAPLWGELPAVLLEAPMMLFLSWLACGASIRMFGLRGGCAGLAMGAVALALLMTTEFVLSRLAFGRSPAETLSAWGTPAGAVGRASQLAFGLIPVLRANRRQKAGPKQF